MRLSIPFIFCFLVSSVVASEVAGKKIEYASVDEAYKKLNEIDNIEWSMQHYEWIMAIDYNHSNAIIWTFTPEWHPAHPSVIKRTKLENDDGVMQIDMDILCESNASDCEMLQESFEQVNAGLKDDGSESDGDGQSDSQSE